MLWREREERMNVQNTYKLYTNSRGTSYHTTNPFISLLLLWYVRMIIMMSKCTHSQNLYVKSSCWFFHYIVTCLMLFGSLLCSCWKKLHVKFADDDDDFVALLLLYPFTLDFFSDVLSTQLREYSLSLSVPAGLVHHHIIDSYNCSHANRKSNVIINIIQLEVKNPVCCYYAAMLLVLLTQLSQWVVWFVRLRELG